MNKLGQLLQESANRHNHLCPKQVLGVRMGLYAGKLLGLELPQKDKRLYTFSETDGCFMDGVGVATGCWPGRRTLNVVDFGKVAATFIDTQNDRAIRIFPNPNSRKDWINYAPSAPDRWHGYLQAYQVMPDEELMVASPVQLNFSMDEIISSADARAICERCGEEIINDRQILVDDSTLCRACAGEAYYRLSTQTKAEPGSCIPHDKISVVSIVGHSGSGKTTLIEKIISELKKRGYRVGTIKHHSHPGIEFDRPGKDTWRHAQAGSDHIVIAAPDQVISIRRVNQEPELTEIAAKMEDVDIILTDGYKRSGTPKIEVIRAGCSSESLCSPEELLAVATDCRFDLPAPRFELNDGVGIVDYLEQILCLKRPEPGL